MWEIQGFALFFAVDFLVSFSYFLIADSRVRKRLCPSVGPSMGLIMIKLKQSKKFILDAAVVAIA